MDKKLLLYFISVFVFIITIGIILKPDNTEKIKRNFQKKQNHVTIGENVTVIIEVADTEEERKKGLADRDNLDENKGMLFVFEEQNVKPRFWMKGTKFPLDIIWINDGKIVQIDENVSPPEPDVPDEKLKIYTPQSEIDYVLEVNGGFAAKNKIKIDDPVKIFYTK